MTLNDHLEKVNMIYADKSMDPYQRAREGRDYIYSLYGIVDRKTFMSLIHVSEDNFRRLNTM